MPIDFSIKPTQAEVNAFLDQAHELMLRLSSDPAHLKMNTVISLALNIAGAGERGLCCLVAKDMQFSPYCPSEMEYDTAQEHMFKRHIVEDVVGFYGPLGEKELHERLLDSFCMKRYGATTDSVTRILNELVTAGKLLRVGFRHEESAPIKFLYFVGGTSITVHRPETRPSSPHPMEHGGMTILTPNLGGVTVKPQGDVDITSVFLRNQQPMNQADVGVVRSSHAVQDPLTQAAIPMPEFRQRGGGTLG